LRTAVVKQVKLYIAAPADELLLALGLGPRLVAAAAYDRRVDREEGAPNILGEGEVVLEAAGIVTVIEDAACAARFVTVLRKKYSSHQVLKRG